MTPSTDAGHLRVHVTFVPEGPAPAAGRFAFWGPTDLAGAVAALGLPAGEEGTFPGVAVVDGELVAADVPARLIPVLPAVRILAGLPDPTELPAWERPSDSLAAWSLGAKLALEYVAAGRVLPTLAAGDRPGAPLAFWRCVPTSDGRLHELAGRMPYAAVALRPDDAQTLIDPPELLRAFCDAVADACAREGRRPSVERRAPGLERGWPAMWLTALTGTDPIVTGTRRRPDELAAAVRDWNAPLLGRDGRGASRLGVTLTAPPADRSGFASGDVWQLTFHLEAADDPSIRIEADAVWEHAGGSLELEGRQLGDPQEALAGGLADAARVFPPLSAALTEARPVGIELDTAEAAAFLDDGVEALRDEDVAVHLPEGVVGLRARRLRPQLRVGGSGTSDPGSVIKSGTGIFSASGLADFRYEIALGDDVLSPAEFAELAAATQPLIRWQGQWVRIDPAEVAALDELSQRTGELPLGEALVAALSGQHEVAGFGLIDTVAEGPVAALVERIRTARPPEEARIVGIEGELRPYQHRGVAWVQALAELGLGGVLADDMGLGKTIQAIAHLTARPGDRPHLVVCPTSVVGNWEREIGKFAPGVDVIRYHGADRPVRHDAFRPGSVTVTSYALMRRDVEFLEEVDWDVVVYDEAQQVKNVASKGAKAARRIPAQLRLAMTGTPVENRLSELWAIVDLVDPGLLGPLSKFTERFAVPIERWRDDDAAQRLRRLVAPFVLRRLKIDPEIAVDLPEKQEVTVVCSLTREQASLYQAVVDEAFANDRLAGGGFARRGRILALLTALKQICNHPAQYLRQPGPLPGRSGKLARTTEVLAEITASGDRALVFTQYRVMGDLLANHLRAELGIQDVPFLHGGVSATGRDEMVRRFQEDEDGPPILLVSLRAGGTGLNLTRATEVIHFDRWWNPAVEDQAADRAHRIGQTRTVTVHTLVAAGTVEDRIAELLERKRSLANAVVGTGEAWITELDEEQLRDLVALSDADVLDDDDDEQPPPQRPLLEVVR